VILLKIPQYHFPILLWVGEALIVDNISIQIQKYVALLDGFCVLVKSFWDELNVVLFWQRN